MLVCVNRERADMERRMKIRNRMIGGCAMAILSAANDCMQTLSGRITGSKNIKRTRKCVEQIFRELGLRNARHSYRMHQESFWKLHGMLFGSDIKGSIEFPLLMVTFSIVLG